MRHTPEKGHVVPSEAQVAAFESRYRLALPDDYRAFLLGGFGATTVDAKVTIVEPTPFGQTVGVTRFFGFLEDPRGTGLAWTTDVIEGEDLVVPVAANMSGAWISLVCRSGGRARKDSVLLRDPEQRHLWPDERFRARFPKLSPSVERYLAARIAKTPPPSGAEGWYVVGASFDDFLERCRPAP